MPQEVKQRGFKITVVKKTGVPLKRLPQRSDRFKPRKCKRENCMVCKAEERGPSGPTCKIATAHLYCVRNFTCHVMHRARALSTKMHNKRADGICYSVDLGRSATPTFLNRYRFYLQLSPHCPKLNKNQCGKFKKISRFLSTRHGIPLPA